MTFSVFFNRFLLSLSATDLRDNLFPIIVIVFVIAIASLIWIDNNAICNHLDLFRKSSGAASKTAETVTKSEFESRPQSNEQEGLLHASRPRHRNFLPVTLALSDSFTVPPFP
jgi:hypothetical protein